MAPDEFGFVFDMLEEGVPNGGILERIEDRRREDETFLDRLAERIRIYRENIKEDAEIPDDVVDDDGQYARMRRLGRDVLPRLDRLITTIAGISTN